MSKTCIVWMKGVISMQNWRNACALIKEKGADAKKQIASYGIFPESLDENRGSYVFMAKDYTGKKLIVLEKGPVYKAFFGVEEECNGLSVKICDLSHENCRVLRQIFAYTAPEAVLGYKRTIGLGDRLGLASPGHIRLIKEYDIKPVLAQQSIRELNLTGRTYENVLDDASWAVFQEGYRGGFGADGDHLKKPEEVEMALNCGFTMITLDCSEHIDNSISGKSDGEVEREYGEMNNSSLEEKYLNKEFTLKNGLQIKFKPAEFKRIVLTYKRAVAFALSIYNNHIRKHSDNVNFEVSIDETLTPSSPQAHFFVASELLDSGAKVATIAPRFCGEFQKGIDYIGEINQFEEEFKVHAAIADHFGYKISVHSGSDKFSVFPIVGRETKGRFHVKTAGTNWLEAIRVIAVKDPGLYREIHKYALEVLDEAKKYYHIGADVNKIPNIDNMKDSELPGLMCMDDSRQVIHITYGLILQAKKPDGKYLFKDRIYGFLNTYEEEYSSMLHKHIKRHLYELGCKSNRFAQ